MATVAGFSFSVSLIALNYQSFSAPSTHKILVEEPNVSFKLPKETTKDEINEFIDFNIQNNNDLVAAAENYLAEWAAKKKAERKKSNRELIVGVVLYWLLCSILLYIFGWSVGWVYRGFKNT